MRRGNRHLVGVVLGGRSGGSRDAAMRNLLAENLDKAATRRTVAAITEHNVSDANIDVAEAEPRSSEEDEAMQASAEPAAAPSVRSTAPATRSILAAAAASVPPQARTEPAPLTNGVIHAQAIGAIPGSSEPLKPVKVKTVQVKASPMKLASAGASQPAPPASSVMPPPARAEVPETSSAVMARAETNKSNRLDVARTDMPPQPANHGTGNGLLGVLPASSLTSPAPQAMAYADPASRPQPPAVQQGGPTQSAQPAAVRTGWIIQVGALESEAEARQRIDAARNQAHGLLAKADPFTETVSKGDKKLVRARFAGLDRDQAEAVCRALKRSDISCITIRN
jgi:D-alanyl-D-alanine carboxypeptidase